MALGKKRGRKPKKSTVKARDAKKMDRHWLDCQNCGLEGAEVDGDVTAFTCGRCAQIGVAAPILPKIITSEEKVARKERKEARMARKAAIARGEVVEKTTKNVLGFGRGWHRKMLFEVEVEGKTRYFTMGKELSKKEFDKLSKTLQSKKDQGMKPTAGWGRGWHLKDTFVSPTGDYFESGSLITPASTKVTEKDLEKEFGLLMNQNFGV